MDNVESIRGANTQNTNAQESPNISSHESVSTKIKKLKNELDPKKVSKMYDPEGRDVTAQIVKKAITDARVTDERIEAKKNELSQVEQAKDASFTENKQKAAALERRARKVKVRIKRWLGVSDKKEDALNAGLELVGQEINDLFGQESSGRTVVKDLELRQAGAATPQQLIDAYYEKVATRPLSNEQKRELLDPNTLAQLSTEEYIALWRRLNPYFLSHVTRQGFRDHIGMEWHSAGMNDFHNGFLHVMNDDRMLRPPLAIKRLRTRDKASIGQFLDPYVLQAEDESQARQRLDDLLHTTLASAPKYPDQTAVHFAAQIVADSYYGGERGNEVFFLYPSDVLASQYNFAFNGWKNDFTAPQSENNWNDVFVWPQTVDNPGIPIDAGMVFLPKNTLVDPETGSKYASEIQMVDGQERRVMIEDTTLVDSLMHWGRSSLVPMIAAIKEVDFYSQPHVFEERLPEFVTALETLGVNTDVSAILASGLGSFLHNEFGDESLLAIIKKSEAQWKRAEHGIPANEYWNDLFARNPALHPKHVHYYDGDPTAAVLEFQQQHNIGPADTSQIDGPLLGFDDHHIQNTLTDSRANVGLVELEATANEIISSHYNQHKD